MSIAAFRRRARHTLTAIRAVFAACMLPALGAAHAAEPRSRGEIVVDSGGGLGLLRRPPRN